MISTSDACPIQLRRSLLSHNQCYLVSRNFSPFNRLNIRLITSSLPGMTRPILRTTPKNGSSESWSWESATPRKESSWQLKVDKLRRIFVRFLWPLESSVNFRFPSCHTTTLPWLSSESSDLVAILVFHYACPAQQKSCLIKNGPCCNSTFNTYARSFNNGRSSPVP